MANVHSYPISASHGSSKLGTPTGQPEVSNSSFATSRCEIGQSAGRGRWLMDN
jgi:hypothetical protein